MRIVTLWLALAAAGCALTAPTPLARVRRGPAIADPPTTILAMPTVCDEPAAIPGYHECAPAFGHAVDAAARMELEFSGFRVVDSERVNAEMKQRVERGVESNGSAAPSQVEIHGIGWLEASAAQRDVLIRQIGLDGFLTARIAIGPPRNLDGQRTVKVEISLTRIRDMARVWTSVCSAETGKFHTTDHAVYIAMQCALESAQLAAR